MAKKAIMCILIFIFVFNIAVPSRVVATSAFTKDDFDDIDQSGTVKRPGYDGETVTSKPQKIQKSKNENGANFGVVGTVLTFLFLPLPLCTQAFLSLAIMPESVEGFQLYTIEDMLLRKIGIV